MKRTFAILTILAALCALAATAAAQPAYTFKFSGYFKADAAFDNARVNSGNYALYVLDRDENGTLNMTARESRFGLDFSWKEGEIVTDARFEWDFYGLGVTSASLNSQENKPTSMLRHAYAQVTKGNWSLLAGQTSDIISPLVPKTVNYTVCWDQGNIGYRRPQIRVSTWGGEKDGTKITAAVGAFRTLGGDLDGDGVDDGADSAIPTFQGRLGLVTKIDEQRTLEVGFSGHIGREDYELAGATQDLESWSANADFKFVCARGVEAMAEFFVGQDLGTYFGGVGQSVNVLRDEIGARGGWAQISVRPATGLWLNAGFGIDDPDDEDFAILPGTDVLQRFFGKNSNIFASVMYDLTSTVTAMVEVSHLNTTYLYKVYEGPTLLSSDDDFDDTRVQFALKAAIK